jgi:hypothetical protein
MWIDNGVCDNSLIICSNFTDADSNQLRIQSFSFFSGRNDPVHVETSFVCEMCPACVLRIDVFSDLTTISDTMNVNCDGSAQTYDLTQNEDFVRVQYSVMFDNSSTATQCVTIDSYRIWQYQDCPATVFQLANYPQTDPGIGPVNSIGCVVNAQSDGTARAGCSEESLWGTVVGDSAPCNCLAGFTPNNDLTACEECGDGLFKATVGNGPCDPCTNGLVLNSDRTGCGCPPGYTGPSCTECAENFFMSSGGACVECPAGSAREVGDDMMSCTCTGNLVNEESSPTTTTTVCSICATGYYRESFKSQRHHSLLKTEPCILCNTSYFRVGEECQPCPGGSSRNIDDPEGSCTCISALVTSDGSTTTSDGPCNKCAENFFMSSGGACVECPAGSAREVGDDMMSCTCTGNLVNGDTTVCSKESSPTTTTTVCSICATGYYRESFKSQTEPCILCNTSYFRVGEECQPCPGGSSRDIGDPEGSCTCILSLVTSDGSTTTSDGPCNNCPKDMLLHDGDCVMCPDFSGRELNSLPGVCVCETNAATPVNSATSTSDPDRGCTACIDGFSRPSASDSCQGITVAFSQEEYSVTESQTANLTVEAIPRPGENQDITVTINSLPLSASMSELRLTSSAPSSSFTVSGYDDSLGLQETRQFMVSLSTPTATDTTIILVTDDDVVQATFQQTDYIVSEGSGSFQVCVVLSIAAVQNVTVMVTGELSQSSGAISAPELGTLSMEVTIPPLDIRGCLSFTLSDDSEVEDVDEQYRLTMSKVGPDDPMFTVDGNVFTTVTITDDDEDEPDEPDEPEADLLPLIVGVSVGGALLAIILAVLCIVCLCIWSVNVKRQGFYHTYEDSQAAPTMLRYSASLRSISSQSVVAVEGKRAAAKENEFFV